MRISKASREAITFACLNFHYAKKVPAVIYGYNVWNDKEEWCGVILFGQGANPAIGIEYEKYQGQVVELVRVALNGKQEETSKALSLALKCLHKEAPWVDLVVSYADLDQEHTGTIYQATNWIYTGVRGTNSVGAIVLFGKKTHTKTIGDRYGTSSLIWIKENVDPYAKPYITKGKHKYLYPMYKEGRKRYSILMEKYPKKESKIGV